MTTLRPDVREPGIERALAALACVWLAAAWLLPNQLPPWLSFLREAEAAAAGMCLVALAWIVRWRAPVTVPLPALVLLGVAFIPWLQFMGGRVSYAGDATLVSLYLVGVALVFWAGDQTRALGRHDAKRWLAWTLLVAGILSTGVALYQWLGLSGLEFWVAEGNPGERAIGNLAQSNHLATLVMFSLAATVWLRSRDVMQEAVAFGLAAFLSLGLALTGSRTPFLGLLLLAAWSLGAPSLRQVPRTTKAALVAWVVIYGVAYWAAQVLPLPLHLRDLGDLGEGPSRLAIGLRPVMWSQFALALQMSPWTGYGWQGGLSAQAAAALLRPGVEVSAYTHDIFFDLLIWNGVPIGVMLSAGLLVWYVRAGVFVRRHGGWFEWAVVTFFGAHALVEYPHAYAFFLVPVAWLAGSLHGARHPRRITVPAPAFAGLVLIAVGAMVVLAVDYLGFADDRTAMMTLQARIGGKTSLPPTPSYVILDQLGQASKWARVTPASGMTAEQIKQQMTLARRFTSVALMRQEVSVLALNGRLDDALTELHRLRGVHGKGRYNETVDQLQKLADGGHAEIRPLLQMIKASEASLPAIPGMQPAAATH